MTVHVEWSAGSAANRRTWTPWLYRLGLLPPRHNAVLHPGFRVAMCSAVPFPLAVCLADDWVHYDPDTPPALFPAIRRLLPGE